MSGEVEHLGLALKTAIEITVRDDDLVLERLRFGDNAAVRIDDARQADTKALIELRKGMIIKSGKRGFARLV